MNLLITTLTLCMCFEAFGSSKAQGYFSGTVAKINQKAGLMRVYVSFKNRKYLNQKDQVEFWDERSNYSKCEGRIIAKSNEYFLLQVKFIDECIRKVVVSNGAYLKFFSQDLVNNLKMGTEVISILKRKYQLYFGKIKKKKKMIDAHLSQMDLINQRYNILREKLEKERRDEITRLEMDHESVKNELKLDKFTLYEIQKKLEQYSMNDDNFMEDRWSLDPKLYIKK